MPREKVLITVKTYPTLSDKYGELVCTAGLREDGSWIRLYPIPFRLQDQGARFKKYQWIELDVVKRTDDPRKESYSPVNLRGMTLGEELKPEDYRRHDAVYKSKIYTSIAELTGGIKKDRVSLATFRPAKIKRMIEEPCEREWDEVKLQKAIKSVKQLTLFDDESIKELRLAFSPARKMPYRFKYVFEDADGQECRLMVEDWELGSLYFNCLKQYDEKTAVQKVKEKYMSFLKYPDLLFFLGTTKAFHAKAPNPFIIIGVYRQSPKMTRTLF